MVINANEVEINKNYLQYKINYNKYVGDICWLLVIMLANLIFLH